MNIWVLGETKTNADKNIDWVSSWPNLVDADVLIIDLTSLYDSTIGVIDYEKFFEASETIIDRLIAGGIIIVITAPQLSTKPANKGFSISNYFLSPFSLNTKNVSVGSEIRYDEQHPFASYLKHVKQFNFVLTHTDYSKITSSKQSYTPTMVSDKKYHVTDKADHDLGFGIGLGAGGKAIFLPPVTEISIREGINKIIEAYRKPSEEQLENAPEWTKNVKLYGITELNKKIEQLNLQKTQLKEETTKKKKEKEIIENFYSLLYAQNKQLENSVRDAFKILGFDEIKRIRNENDEDWVIDLKTLKGVDHGILEVKGRNEKTKHSDIVQCNKWVDDYHLMEPPKTTKGIFISNQFRLKPYPDSKDKRTKFEPNELEYAKTRQICIIPSYVLFEAVNNVLAGKKKTRKEIEKFLYEANGILTKL